MIYTVEEYFKNILRYCSLPMVKHAFRHIPFYRENVHKVSPSIFIQVVQEKNWDPKPWKFLGHSFGENYSPGLHYLSLKSYKEESEWILMIQDADVDYHFRTFDKKMDAYRAFFELKKKNSLTVADVAFAFYNTTI